MCVCVCVCVCVSHPCHRFRRANERAACGTHPYVCVCVCVCVYAVIEVTTDTTKGLLWVSPEGPLDTLYAPVDNAELLNDKKVFRNSEQAEEGDYE